MHSLHQNHPRNADDLHPELPRTTRGTFDRFELGRLVKAWSDSGAALPVAVVVSIFDDLCESLGDAPTDVALSPWSHPLALDHVVIDQGGIARLTVKPSEPVLAMARLLYDTLSAGQGDLGVPAAARPLLEQGMASDPLLRPQATETLQRLLRTSLGPPAQREEVVAACAVLPRAEDPGLLEIPSLVGPAMTQAPRAVVEAQTPLPVVMAAVEPLEDPLAGIAIEDPVSFRPRPAEAPPPLMVSALVPPPAPEQAAALAPSLSPPPASLSPNEPAPLNPAEPPPLFPRAVVRHELPKRRAVSLPAAPAARLGAGPSLADERSREIQLPSEGRGTLWLLGFLFVCVGILIAWMLGLFS